MKEVARFADVYEAELAVGFLAAHGVWAVTADRGLATIDPVLQRALGGVRVMTAETDAEAARGLLARARAGEFAEPDPEPAPARRAAGPFEIVTALAAFVVGHGYAGHAYVGERGRLNAVQVVGLALLSFMVLAVLAAVLIGPWLG